MARVSLRAYARHRGCALYAVQKAIAGGRIAKGEDGLIDVEAADAAWAANTNAAKAPLPPAPPEPTPPLLSGELLPAPAMKGLDWSEWPNWKPVENPPPAVEGGRVIPPDAFMAARTRLAHADAELREMELAKQKGLAIDSETARRAFREIGRIYAGARAGLEHELAPQLVGLTDPNEIGRRIKAAVLSVDERIANEIAARFGDYVERSGAAG